MSDYICTISRITHWHEHRIHQQISPILDYDTWTIGTALAHIDQPETIDVQLRFRHEDDFPKVMDIIRAICSCREPGR